MTARRICLLFAYAFGSMTVPVLLGLLIVEYAGAAVTLWIETNLLAFTLCLLAYGLLQVFLVFPLIGSWAAAVSPESGPRLPTDELRKKLLLLNDERLPFRVMRDSLDPDRLVASWKIADEKWAEIFAARGLRMQYELRMRLLEGRGVVAAQDNFRKFEYVAGATGGAVKFAFTVSFFKGISLFQYARGAKYGVIFKDGELKIDYAYNYRFHIGEIKNPIIEIVTQSGWEYRPVVFFPPG